MIEPMSPSTDEPFEVKCPKCKRQVKVAPKDAERSMKVRCPCGEDIPLVKMI
jgi:lysyl-tRNA synthetase class I